MRQTVQAKLKKAQQKIAQLRALLMSADENASYWYDEKTVLSCQLSSITDAHVREMNEVQRSYDDLKVEHEALRKRYAGVLRFESMLRGAEDQLRTVQTENDEALRERDAHRSQLVYVYRLARTGQNRPGATAESKMLFTLLADELEPPKPSPMWWLAAIAGLAGSATWAYNSLSKKEKPGDLGSR